MEVWGKELNKKAVETSVKHDERRAPEKKSVMSGIGKKLLAKTSFSASWDGVSIIVTYVWTK